MHGILSFYACNVFIPWWCLTEGSDMDGGTCVDYILENGDCHYPAFTSCGCIPGEYIYNRSLIHSGLWYRNQSSAVLLLLYVIFNYKNTLLQKITCKIVLCVYTFYKLYQRAIHNQNLILKELNVNTTQIQTSRTGQAVWVREAHHSSDQAHPSVRHQKAEN